MAETASLHFQGQVAKHDEQQYNPFASFTSSAPQSTEPILPQDLPPIEPSPAFVAARSTKRNLPAPLPSFSFNPSSTASNESIYSRAKTPPQSPTFVQPDTPTRGGRHRRTRTQVDGSETASVHAIPVVLGGLTATSSAGMPISQSLPILSNFSSAPQRGHRHRRSGAIASQDISALQIPPVPPIPTFISSANIANLNSIAQSRRQRSRSPKKNEDPITATLDLARVTENPPTHSPSPPPALRQSSVAFSDQLEYIPNNRPTSLVSTESGSTIAPLSIDLTVGEAPSNTAPSGSVNFSLDQDHINSRPKYIYSPPRSPRTSHPSNFTFPNDSPSAPVSAAHDDEDDLELEGGPNMFDDEDDLAADPGYDEDGLAADPYDNDDDELNNVDMLHETSCYTDEHPDQSRAALPTFSFGSISHVSNEQNTESSILLDLDAALGSFNTPRLPGTPDGSVDKGRGRGFRTARHTMHSSTGPGVHRRAESMPSLEPAASDNRLNSSASDRGFMIDNVFEEEEEPSFTEDNTPRRPKSYDTLQRTAQSQALGTQEHTITASSIAVPPPWNSRFSLSSDRPIHRRVHQRSPTRLAAPRIEVMPVRTTADVLTTSEIDVDVDADAFDHDALDETIVPVTVADDPDSPAHTTRSSDSTIEAPVKVEAFRPTATQSPSSFPTTVFAPALAPSISPGTPTASSISSPPGSATDDHFRPHGGPLSYDGRRAHPNSMMSDSSRSDVRQSVDDVPSLISSRSTATSYMYNPNGSISSHSFAGIRDSAGSSYSYPSNGTTAEQRRRNRNSIVSLSRLMSGSFGGSSVSNLSIEQRPPQTADGIVKTNIPTKKGGRLGRLLKFWKERKPNTSVSGGGIDEPLQTHPRTGLSSTEHT